MSNCGEVMDFPKTFDEFAEQYSIKDTEERYSNGVEFIPVFRVEQWLEHKDIHGEWIPKERTTECSVDIDIVCSECGYVGIEGYAHGYELNELPVQEMKDYIKKFDMNYCPCCGAKMDKGDI